MRFGIFSDAEKSCFDVFPFQQVQHPWRNSGNGPIIECEKDLLLIRIFSPGKTGINRFEEIWRTNKVHPSEFWNCQIWDCRIKDLRIPEIPKSSDKNPCIFIPFEACPFSAQGRLPARASCNGFQNLSPEQAV
jgi:hypothetical protein